MESQLEHVDGSSDPTSVFQQVHHLLHTFERVQLVRQHGKKKKTQQPSKEIWISNVMKGLVLEVWCICIRYRRWAGKVCIFNGAFALWVNVRIGEKVFLRSDCHCRVWLTPICHRGQGVAVVEDIKRWGTKSLVGSVPDYLRMNIALFCEGGGVGGKGGGDCWRRALPPFLPFAVFNAACISTCLS